MDANKIWVTVGSNRADEFLVADVMYSGVEWTSVTEVDGELAMTLYPTKTPIPLEAAILSLEEVRGRLSLSSDNDEPSS
ncbi:MAG: hypothetical protein QOE87_3968 [Gaiellales bacterium]|jgi:hypothetical protein|nr:hypothetical protein [Gaiellales bacterium]